MELRCSEFLAFFFFSINTEKESHHDVLEDNNIQYDNGIESLLERLQKVTCDSLSAPPSTEAITSSTSERLQSLTGLISPDPIPHLPLPDPSNAIGKQCPSSNFLYTPAMKQEAAYILSNPNNALVLQLTDLCLPLSFDDEIKLNAKN